MLESEDNMRHTDIIVQLASRENQMYALAASGKVYLMKVHTITEKGSNKPLINEDGEFVLSHEWELVLDSPEVRDNDR